MSKKYTLLYDAMTGVIGTPDHAWLIRVPAEWIDDPTKDAEDWKDLIRECWFTSKVERKRLTAMCPCNNCQEAHWHDKINTQPRFWESTCPTCNCKKEVDQ